MGVGVIIFLGERLFPSTDLLPAIALSPLDATLMDLPASVANKRLTELLSLLDATLTKNPGGGREGYGLGTSLSVPTPFERRRNPTDRLTATQPSLPAQKKAPHSSWSASLRSGGGRNLRLWLRLRLCVRVVLLVVDVLRRRVLFVVDLLLLGGR